MIHDFSCKTLIGPKPLQIRFHKIDWVITIYYGPRYLTLFGLENYDAVYIRIRHLISLKRSITYIFLFFLYFSRLFLSNFAKIKVDSYDSLPIEKRLTLHVLIVIKSVLNQDKPHYYYKIFLEK